MEDKPIGKSLDPRMNRVELVPAGESYTGAEALDQFQTFQVFHQEKRGERHVHVGIVHAPNPEMALLYAKEQYARRGQCVNLWVVRTADVFATEYEDEDIFQPATDKAYREAHYYKNREVIDEFKRRMDTIAGKHFREVTTQADGKPPATSPQKKKGAIVVKGKGGKKPVIVVGKKK